MSEVTVTLTYTEEEAREVVRALVGSSPEDYAAAERIALIRSAILLALPKPKPDEPTGLGAVVEDRDGIRWVRSLRADVEFSTPWRDCNDDHFARHYDAIEAVRVLSEGVTQ